MHDALDQVRREQVRQVRGTDQAYALEKTRIALQKNPWNLTVAEHEKIATVQRTNRPLYRGLMLEQTLCAALDRRQPNVARQLFEEWIAWATRSRRAQSRSRPSAGRPRSGSERSGEP